MKIFITSVPRNSIKTYFLNFRSYSLVDTITIQEEEMLNIYHNENILDMVINQRILEELKRAKRRRKSMDLVYISRNINENILNNLIEFFGDVDKFIFIEGQCKNQETSDIVNDINKKLAEQHI